MPVTRRGTSPAGRSGGLTQALDWDAAGELARATEGGRTTSFVYDASGTRLIRRDPAGTTLYLDGQLTWLASDHQGTAQIAIRSETQEVVQRRQLPFGGPRGAAVAFPGEQGFVGGTTDASTGFTHLGAREYDQETGRFISVDPILDLGDAQQLNGYTYSNNSPVTRSDPSGLLSCRTVTAETARADREPRRPRRRPPPRSTPQGRPPNLDPTGFRTSR